MIKKKEHRLNFSILLNVLCFYTVLNLFNNSSGKFANGIIFSLQYLINPFKSIVLSGAPVIFTNFIPLGLL